MADDTPETIVEIETERARRGDGPTGFFYDRRHVSLPALVAIVTLIAQLGAIIWGAARLTGAVENLRVVAHDLQSDMHATQADVSSLKIDVGILKSRTDK